MLYKAFHYLLKAVVITCKRRQIERETDLMEILGVSNQRLLILIIIHPTKFALQYREDG